MQIDKVKKENLFQYLTQIGYSQEIVEIFIQETVKNPGITVIRMRRGNPSGLDGIVPINDNLDDCLFHLQGVLIEFAQIV